MPTVTPTPDRDHSLLSSSTQSWVVDGKIVLRSVLTATLSADHRVSDGHRSAIFLAAVDRVLLET
jgi:pyruvate/2-oxoglutarate dehydrogenase complex dihydrolipoamide acyltransferase (E2) component